MGQTSLDGGSKCVSQRVASREGRNPTGTSPLERVLLRVEPQASSFWLNFPFSWSHSGGREEGGRDRERERRRRPLLCSHF